MSEDVCVGYSFVGVKDSMGWAMMERGREADSRYTPHDVCISTIQHQQEEHNNYIQKW